MTNSRSKKVKALSFVGYSGSGKTTLIEKIIPLIINEGIKLGVIKHDAHQFEIDHKGKDSYRFKAAGANSVMISNDQKLGLISTLEAPLKVETLIKSYFSQMDFVLVEGHKSSVLDKVLVCRGPLDTKIFEHLGAKPIALATDQIHDPNWKGKILDLNNTNQIFSFVLNYFKQN